MEIIVGLTGVLGLGLLGRSPDWTRGRCPDSGIVRAALPRSSRTPEFDAERLRAVLARSWTPDQLRCSSPAAESASLIQLPEIEDTWARQLQCTNLIGSALIGLQAAGYPYPAAFFLPKFL